MKVCIAGSRTFNNRTLMKEVIAETGLKISEVVSGGAAGADRLGELWAEANGVPIRQFKANWSLYGKSAGPRRNKQMAEYCDAAILFWDGQSKGTWNMMDQLTSLGKEYYIKQYK